MLSDYVRCPHCDNLLGAVDHYDVYEADVDTTIYYATGRCYVCGKNYRWEEVFKYNHFENLEEIE